jgi:predicted nucleic acid-binding protein
LPRAQETLVDEALALLSGYAADRISLIAPDLLWPEFANILWKSVRQQRISALLANEAIGDLLALDIVPVASSALLNSAFAIATAFERTVYDALYVALAEENGAPVVTADERLVNRLGFRFPIGWLGAYQGRS